MINIFVSAIEWLAALLKALFQLALAAFLLGPAGYFVYLGATDPRARDCRWMGTRPDLASLREPRDRLCAGGLNAVAGLGKV